MIWVEKKKAVVTLLFWKEMGGRLIQGDQLGHDWCSLDERWWWSCIPLELGASPISTPSMY